MLSIYYAKKTSNGYILNFFADSTDDVEAFDPDKSWGMYGKPIPGSVLTVTSNEDVFNYYLNESGALVEIAIDKPVEELIPFRVGQTISGIDFGNVQNGDTNDVLDAFTMAAGESEHSQILFVASDGDINLLRANDGTNGFLALLIEGEDPIPLYATEAHEVEGLVFTKGYQNLTGGKYNLDTSATLNLVNSDIEGWNGILVGAIEAEPVPSTLTPFSLNQYISGYKVNVEGDKAALDSFLADFPTSYGTHKLILEAGSGSDDDLHINVANTISGDVQTWDNYVLFIIGGDAFFAYSTETQTAEVQGTPLTVPAGWSQLNPQNMTFNSISTNQEITFESSKEVTICDSLADPINGVYVGAIPGEEPEPTGLTPISVGQDVTGYKFNINKSGSDVVDIISGFDLKSITDGVIVDGSNDHGIIQVYYDDKDYFLYVIDGGTQVVVFDGVAWNHLNEDGVYTLSQSASITGVESSYATGWNGILIGAILK